MLTLIFDTETTGFGYKELPLDHPKQPYIVQLAAIISEDAQCIHSWTTIIHCPIEVPDGAFRVHGISREQSLRDGVTNKEAMAKFENLFRSADRIVAHNASYDIQMIRIAQARASAGDSKTFSDKPVFCTMKTLSEQARREGRNARWPKLQVAYQTLIDPAGFDGAHSADADTLACFKVLQAIEEKNWPLHQI